MSTEHLSQEGTKKCDPFDSLVEEVKKYFPIVYVSYFWGHIASEPFPWIIFRVTPEDIIGGNVKWVKRLIYVWNREKSIHWQFIPDESQHDPCYTLLPKDKNMPKSQERLVELRKAAGDLAHFIEAWAAGNNKKSKKRQ
ncbi:MAG: hypothetical protein Q7S57_05985 [bacterium]|nr:hypothetical protein [bacterium]